MHESGLLAEYKRKCGACGIQPIFAATTAADASSSGDVGSKWQHPEKQKTLIHTAPVMSPTSDLTARTAAPRNTAEVGSFCFELLLL